MSTLDILARIGADGRRALNELRREGGEPLVEPTLEVLRGMISALVGLDKMAKAEGQETNPTAAPPKEGPHE